MDPTTNPDLDFNLDRDPDLDLDAEAGLAPGNVDFTFFEPISGAGIGTGIGSAETEPEPLPGKLPELAASADERRASTKDKAYHTKRPHRKSRAGCKQCKSRKVKCDEGRPSCRACTLRRETCVFPEPVSLPAALRKTPKPDPTFSGSDANSRSPTPQQDADDSDASAADGGSGSGSTTMVVAEPIFRPVGMGDEIDMRMLWFYTTKTYDSFSIESGFSPVVDHALKVRSVEIAFQSPFLMQCLMGMSALHLKSLGQPVPHSKTLTYRAQAFEGYRSAIEAARPADYPALLACSLFMAALSSEMFRDPESKPLFIVDWMVVWRGIGLIVDLITPQSIQGSGLAVLFYRPPIDLDKSARYIPNNLLSMVNSIAPGDADYEHKQIYYDVLKYLGSLYTELEFGFSPMMDLRIITFFTFMPRPFLRLAQEHRPRALVILAYYSGFTKLIRRLWWMQGIGNRQIQEITEAVGENWLHMLHVPRKVMYLENKLEIAKELIDDNSWTAPTQDEETDERQDPKIKDPRVRDLGLITNDGVRAKIVDGQWILNEPTIFMDKLNLSDPQAPRSLPAKKLAVGLEGYGVLSSLTGDPLNTSDGANSSAFSSPPDFMSATSES